MLKNSLWIRHKYSHFIDDKTEAQKSKESCRRSHSPAEVMELESEPDEAPQSGEIFFHSFRGLSSLMYSLHGPTAEF